MEQWKPVVGFEDYYEVSDLGRVKSLARTCYAGNNSHRRVDERILKGMPSGRDRDGTPRKYVAVHLHGDGFGCRREIQTIVLEAFRGPRPAGWQARHLNGTKNDNRLDNLVWGTVAENNADMDVHGTRSRGSRKFEAKLSASDIPVIRSLRTSGSSWGSLAAQYGVSKTAIRQVINGATWTHV